MKGLMRGLATAAIAATLVAGALMTTMIAEPELAWAHEDESLIDKATKFLTMSDDTLSDGIAMTGALASIPDMPEGELIVFGLGAGHYDGSTGIGLATEATLFKRTTLRVNVATSLEGGFLAGAGVSFAF